jgi:TonB family protein
MTQLLRAVAAGIFLCASPLRAQIVAGQVIDQRGVPIPGVAVYLVDSALAVADSTVADSTGTFYLTASKTGQYSLRVAASGALPVYTRPFPLSTTEVHQERIALNVVPDARIYFEFEVQERVKPLPGNRPPQYPPSLRKNHIEGQVLLQFVVDSTGRPLPRTTKVLRSSHDDFTKAVLLVLPGFRFEPARRGGRSVAQLVQMPFHFNLTP